MIKDINNTNDQPATELWKLITLHVSYCLDLWPAGCSQWQNDKWLMMMLHRFTRSRKNLSQINERRDGEQNPIHAPACKQGCFVYKMRRASFKPCQIKVC